MCQNAVSINEGDVTNYDHKKETEFQLFQDNPWTDILDQINDVFTLSDGISKYIASLSYKNLSTDYNRFSCKIFFSVSNDKY